MDTVWLLIFSGISFIWKFWASARWIWRYFSWTHCGRCGGKTVPTFTRGPDGDFFCTECDPDIWEAYLEKDKKEDPLKPEDESDKLNLEAWPIGSKERMAYEARSQFSAIQRFLAFQKKTGGIRSTDLYYLDNPNTYR